MKFSTKKLVMAAMLATLCCVATLVIKVPTQNGYLNLGDCVVLISGFLLSPTYGFLAAGLGSALADLFSGYVIYAPVTFFIKGAMALVAHYGSRLLPKKMPKRVLGGLAAEVLMVLGYYVFEGFLYGFGTASVNIPANAIQGLAGLVLGLTLVKLFENKL